jgi:ABC-type multidrug transport system fused ATPase/permease subunit
MLLSSPELPPALYDMSLRITPGSTVAVCGRSGRYLTLNTTFSLALKANVTLG